jgi:hypothetical protein
MKYQRVVFMQGDDAKSSTVTVRTPQSNTLPNGIWNRAKSSTNRPPGTATTFHIELEKIITNTRDDDMKKKYYTARWAQAGHPSIANVSFYVLIATEPLGRDDDIEFTS